MNEFLAALSKVVSRRLVADIAKFEPRDRPARQGRSPATGEMISKDADKAVSIRAATGLKAAVNA